MEIIERIIDPFHLEMIKSNFSIVYLSRQACYKDHISHLETSDNVF